MIQNDPYMQQQQQQGMIQQQLMPGQPMMMYPGQPQIIVVNSNGGEKRWEPSDWEHGLCGCFDDIPTCLASCICPCYQYGQNNEQLLQTSCTGPCISYFCLMYCGLQCCISAPFRGALRSKFNIQGDSTCDCFVSWCCACCSLAQSAREIDSRKIEATQKGLKW